LRGLSPKEECILALLVARGERYGLELVDASQGELKRGTIYVTLSRMEEKGLVDGRIERAPKHSGLPRHLYRATALGARLLEAQRAFDRAYACRPARA
jgi:DNA-binding PadR family transcriptional regulator